MNPWSNQFRAPMADPNVNFRALSEGKWSGPGVFPEAEVNVKLGTYVRHGGRIGEILSLTYKNVVPYEEKDNYVAGTPVYRKARYVYTVQFGPLGKRRHKHRRELQRGEFEILNEMEVLAMADQ